MPDPGDAGWCRRLGLEPGRFVLFVGRLVPENNAHLLVEAHRALRRRLAAGGGGRRARTPRTTSPALKGGARRRTCASPATCSATATASWCTAAAIMVRADRGRRHAPGDRGGHGRGRRAAGERPPAEPGGGGRRGRRLPARGRRRALAAALDALADDPARRERAGAPGGGPGGASATPGTPAPRPTCGSATPSPGDAARGSARVDEGQVVARSRRSRGASASRAETSTSRSAGQSIADVGVVPGEAPLERGVVVGRAAVDDVGDVADDHEAVGEADRAGRLAVGPRRRARTASQRPKVGEPRRMSTATSRIAPRAQRTSLAWPRADREVHAAQDPPRRARVVVLHPLLDGCRALGEASARKVSTKKPRASRWTAGSMTTMPERRVAERHRRSRGRVRRMATRRWSGRPAATSSAQPLEEARGVGDVERGLEGRELGEVAARRSADRAGSGGRGAAFDERGARDDGQRRGPPGGASRARRRRARPTTARRRAGGPAAGSAGCGCPRRRPRRPGERPAVAPAGDTGWTRPNSRACRTSLRGESWAVDDREVVAEAGRPADPVTVGPQARGQHLVLAGGPDRRVVEAGRPHRRHAEAVAAALREAHRHEILVAVGEHVHQVGRQVDLLRPDNPASTSAIDCPETTATSGFSSSSATARAR